jgi:IPT/TIG domain
MLATWFFTVFSLSIQGGSPAVPSPRKHWDRPCFRGVWSMYHTALIGGLKDNSGKGATWVFVNSPVITGVNPNTGPVTGGTTVTITGTNFGGVTAVTFGSTSAMSFTVNSEGSITAVSPAEAPGTVNVTVTTPAGTSAISPADRFEFVG